MMDTLFGAPAPWFTAPALLGTGFLLLQILMGQIGGDLDTDLDVDLDVDLSADVGDTAGHGHHHDPSTEAKWLSLQSLAAFMIGFGWIGLAALRLLGMGFTAAAFIGVLSGFGVAWMLVALLRALMKVQSDANVSLRDAVGLEGDVHVIVPPRGGGSGRVALVINQSRHEFNAVQDGEAPIASHSRVRVLHADPASGTITVKPA